MLKLDDISELEPEGVKPSTFRDVSEGDLSDLYIREAEPGHRYLGGTVWNPDENVYITDYHNKVMPAWLAASNEWAGEESIVVHLDGHRDDRELMDRPGIEEAYLLGDAAGMTEEVGIAEIMTVVSELDMFDDTYFWGCLHPAREEVVNSLDELSPPLEDYDRVLLDVDLDLFENLDRYPPSGGSGLEEYYSAVSRLEETADLTTYATSPGFIDQGEAVDHLAAIRESST